MDKDKEIKIVPPEGYEIDESKSTFECIKFKKKPEDKFRGSGKYIKGHRPLIDGTIVCCTNYREGGDGSYLVFLTKKEAESALAMAQLSQIIANDKRFGGPITDVEWGDSNIIKYCITRKENEMYFYNTWDWHYFLSFHTTEQRQLFVEENEDLIKRFLMID